jgi:pimeloyl-ACP methyl ester carboxylesterase
MTYCRQISTKKWLSEKKEAVLKTANALFQMTSGLAMAGLMVSCAHRVTIRPLPLPGSDPARELAAARAAFLPISRGNPTATETKSYNDSVRRVLQHAHPDGANGWSIGAATVPVDDRLHGVVDAGEAIAVLPADSLRVRGFRKHIVTDGVGAPVVLHFPAAGLTPQEGRFQPATAVLEFDGPDATPRVVLHDTLAESESAHGPLRADFTAPLASRFAALKRQRINLPALLLPEKFSDELGVTQFDAVDPAKIPVVFIHGLKSAPITWRNTMNELRADPLIRARYEFWTYGYGTGVPLPFSAMKLREALAGVATYREHLGAKTGDMVLIGHSMGGLLSRIMTERSGDENWYELFTMPVEELPLPENDREILRRMAYFEPLPYVRRVAFIATPHGGSRIADDPIGQVTAQLIRLPTQLISLSTSVIRAPFSLLTPAGQQVVARPPTSIHQLESKSDLLRRLKSMPLNPRVTFHSIIGNLGLPGPLATSTDGVVPYASAHLEGVKSEKIVPTWHNAHLHPESIAELRRILREHLGTGP